MNSGIGMIVTAASVVSLVLCYLYLRRRPRAKRVDESATLDDSAESQSSPSRNVRPPVDGSDLLANGPWLKLVEECVALVDELHRERQRRADFGDELADHVVCRLREILERSCVTPIDGDSTFDRNRHRPLHAGGRIPPDGTIETISPGFRVGSRVLRRAVVRVVARLESKNNVRPQTTDAGVPAE